MEEGQKFRYVKVPIQMIPLLYDGIIGIKTVCLYSLYRAGMQFDISEKNVIRRLVYQYLNVEPKNRKVGIPKELVDWLDDWDDKFDIIGWNADYRGFDPNGQDYDPMDSEDDYVIDTIFSAIKDTPMWDLAEEYYRLGQVANLLKIKIPSTDIIIETHKKYEVYDNTKIYAYAKFDKMLELWNREKNLTEEDIEIYAGNLALKSIIGKKKVGHTDSKLILARMAGCVGKDDVTEDYLANCNPNAAKVYKKYSDKDNFRRLAGRLRDGYVKYIEVLPGKPRYGYFFSFSRDLSKNELESEIESMIADEKKEAARNRKRLERKRKKAKCRKMVGLNVTSVQERKKTSSLLPNRLPF